MNIQEKVIRAKQAVDFIASHDDETVQAIQDALEQVGAHAKAAGAATVKRRLGSVTRRTLAYFARLGASVAGR